MLKRCVPAGRQRRARPVGAALVAAALYAGPIAEGAQQPAQAAPNGGATSAGAVVPMPDYLIGPDDVLSIMFWREKELSAEVIVRPDGKISLPLLNDVVAAGLTPEQLRQRVMEQAQQFIQDPNATVVVRQINSRRVFIVGSVAKPGPYPLTGPTTVLQLIAIAGGLQEYADAGKVSIMRTEGGRTMTYRFNYRDVVKRKNLRQNIELKPGDTVIVP